MVIIKNGTRIDLISFQHMLRSMLLEAYCHTFV